jgi:hypothetical protein
VPVRRLRRIQLRLSVSTITADTSRISRHPRTQLRCGHSDQNQQVLGDPRSSSAAPPTLGLPLYEIGATRIKLPGIAPRIVAARISCFVGVVPASLRGFERIVVIVRRHSDVADRGRRSQLTNARLPSALPG